MLLEHEQLGMPALVEVATFDSQYARKALVA
jgi:hypothetical protein